MGGTRRCRDQDLAVGPPGGPGGARCRARAAASPEGPLRAPRGV